MTCKSAAHVELQEAVLCNLMCPAGQLSCLATFGRAMEAAKDQKGLPAALCHQHGDALKAARKACHQKLNGEFESLSDSQMLFCCTQRWPSKLYLLPSTWVPWPARHHQCTLCLSRFLLGLSCCPQPACKAVDSPSCWAGPSTAAQHFTRSRKGIASWSNSAAGHLKILKNLHSCGTFMIYNSQHCRGLVWQCQRLVHQ